MSKSGYMEVNLTKPLKYEFRMKINDLVSVLKQEIQIISDLIEIFPDIKVQFVLMPNPLDPGEFRLELFAPREGSNKYAKFAGKVNVDLSTNKVIGVCKAEAFGNVKKNEFINFLTNWVNGLHLPALGPFRFDSDTLKGSGEITAEVKWTIYMRQPVSVFKKGTEIPKSVLSQESRSVVGMAMKEDVSTADLSIKCGDEIFRVHKVVLCSRSPVFRAMMQGNMIEARKGEVSVKDVDSGTFAAMLHYVYTGELKEGQDLNNMIYVADKYDLPGLKELLFLNMKLEDVQEEFVPDLLIIADKHQAGQLKKHALEKIRANRKILKEEGLQTKLATYPHILFDIMEQL